VDNQKNRARTAFSIQPRPPAGGTCARAQRTRSLKWARSPTAARGRGPRRCGRAKSWGRVMQNAC